MAKVDDIIEVLKEFHLESHQSHIRFDETKARDVVEMILAGAEDGVAFQFAYTSAGAIGGLAITAVGDDDFVDAKIGYCRVFYVRQNCRDKDFSSRFLSRVIKYLTKHSDVYYMTNTCSDKVMNKATLHLFERCGLKRLEQSFMFYGDGKCQVV